MKGSVGRAFAKAKRYKEDKVYREKRKEIRRKYGQKNRDKELARRHIWERKLNEFRNRKCKECGKLLHYKTEGDYCNKHFWKHKRKK